MSIREESAMTAIQAATHIVRPGLLLTAILIGNSAFAEPILMDCGVGQSLNRTLSHLDKKTPAVIKVKGTCTEYVQVKGFEDLTIRGVNGARLIQPANPGSVSAVLLIGASRRVTIDALKVSATTAEDGIGIGQASSDIRLRNGSAIHSPSLEVSPFRFIRNVP